MSDEEEMKDKGVKRENIILVKDGIEELVNNIAVVSV